MSDGNSSQQKTEPVGHTGAISPRVPGALAGKIWISADFDTLPDDMAESLGIQEAGETAPGHGTS